MLLEISLFMIVVVLMLRFSSKWVGLLNRATETREKKVLAESLDWDRPAHNKKLRKPNALVRFWRG